MSEGHPGVPQFVEDGGIVEVSQVDRHLQQPSAITADLSQSLINELQRFGNLAACILLDVAGHFDKVRGAVVNDGVGPAASDSQTLNLAHGFFRVAD